MSPPSPTRFFPFPQGKSLKGILALDDPSLFHLQAKLEEYYKFPCSYFFKFIAPMAQAEELTALLKGRPFTKRFSRNGRYVSFTAEWEVASSEEVISYYRRAGKIKGVISL
jgi:putative lipoic acid-binding regulatory protein